MSEPLGRVIIYGGKGALGSTCVHHFKESNWWVASIDFEINDEADLNILVTDTEGLHEQETKILEVLQTELNSIKVDSVLCVAGGWTSGNTKKDLAKHADLMWRQNVWSSIISASISSKHLKESGLLTLTGANVALRETPGMIGYGLAKAAVHHLTKSLAGNNISLPLESSSGLPYHAICVAILPTILDTPINRGWMPKADISSWTPLKFVVELLWKWSNHKQRPPNGSLLQLITRNFMTEVTTAESLWKNDNTNANNV